MYEMQKDASSTQAEASAEIVRLDWTHEGDFAAGVRTQPAARLVLGDFATGLRCAQNLMVVGDFASGLRALPDVISGRGDFASGQRGQSSRRKRHADGTIPDHGSASWPGPELVGVLARP